MLFLLLSCLCSSIRAESAASSAQAWEKPRNLSDFQSLLNRSPFSLPTAEETSPLADRYALTGIVTFNGEEEVFVFDRTDQSHSILTHMPNSNSMALVSLVREGTLVPQKATIRVGTDTGTIGYLEAAPQPQGQPAPQPPAGAPAGILPRLPQLPQQPEVAPPPTRRIIRRPMVTPPHP